MEFKNFEHEKLGQLRAVMYKGIVFFVGRDILALTGRNISNFSNIAKYCKSLNRVNVDGKSLIIFSLSDALGVVENTRMATGHKIATKCWLTAVAEDMIGKTPAPAPTSIETLKQVVETTTERLAKITKQLQQEQEQLQQVEQLLKVLIKD